MWDQYPPISSGSGAVLDKELNEILNWRDSPAP